MKGNSEKKCALIRQTWFESAKANLQPSERLCFYETCFEYEFYAKEPERDNIPFSSVLLMFDMVKDALADDRAKAEAIATRNRRNGLAGGRPKKVTESYNEQETQVDNCETQKTQVDNLGLHYTTQHNTTQQKNISVFSSSGGAEIEKTEKFLIAYNFFSNGVLNPVQEMERFWAYYAARGWCINKNTPIQDRVALSKIWKAETADGGLVATRADFAHIMQVCEVSADDGLLLLTDFRFLTIDKKQRSVTISFANTNRCVDIIEKTDYLRKLEKWMPSDEQGKFSLGYIIRPV